MTYRQAIQEIADEQYGYITTSDVRRLGIPENTLCDLANRGKVKQVRRGLYRFPNTKQTQQDVFATALFSVGQGSYLVADAVLALHDLGLVNPTKIRVRTKARVRHELPAYIALEQRDEDDEIEIFEGIATTRVARAILDCQGMVMTERLTQALISARDNGLVTHREFLEVRKSLRAKLVHA